MVDLDDECLRGLGGFKGGRVAGEGKTSAKVGLAFLVETASLGVRGTTLVAESMVGRPSSSTERPGPWMVVFDFGRLEKSCLG